MIDIEEKVIVVLTRLRENRGWSQSELARRMVEAGHVNYTQMTVSRTEKHERPLRLNELAALAHVYGVGMSDLYGEQERPHLRSEIMTQNSTLIRTVKEYTDRLDQIAERLS